MIAGDFTFTIMSQNDHEFGNRITANAKDADDGQVLIGGALKYIEDTYGYAPVDQEALFKGVYYDSKKVGSFIIMVRRENGDAAVLKLQLLPLPFDEGFIIRNIEKNLRTDVVHP